MNKLKHILTASLLLATLGGCNTYYLTVDSFKSQFEGVDSTTLKQVKIKTARQWNYEYLANTIDSISCIDSDSNKEVKIARTPSTQLQFTDEHNRKKSLYFDTIFLQDSLVVGNKERQWVKEEDRTYIPIRTIKSVAIKDAMEQCSYIK